MDLGMIMMRVLSQLLPEVDPETGLELKCFTWEVIPGSTVIGVGAGVKTGKQGHVSQHREHYVAGSSCRRLGFTGAVQNVPQGLRNWSIYLPVPMCCGLLLETSTLWQSLTLPPTPSPG